MKKLFAVLAVSAFLFACNDASTSTETTTDSSTVAPVETPAPSNDSLAAPMVSDSTVKVDSTMK